MFYDRFKKLCEKKGVSCSKAISDIGLSNSTATKWKKTGALPTLDTLLKIAAYFDMPYQQLIPPILDVELQQQLWDVFENAIQSRNLTEGEVILKSGCQFNFFTRLKNQFASFAPIEEIELAADYLGITDSVHEIIPPYYDEASIFDGYTAASIHAQFRNKSPRFTRQEEELVLSYRSADPIDKALVQRVLHISEQESEVNAG